MSPYAIRPLTAADQAWVVEFMTEHWGAPQQVVRGEIFWPHTLPGFVAAVDGELVGPATSHQRKPQLP